jgi:hypothetical protein
MNESAYCYGQLCVCVCLSVTFVNHAQSFELSIFGLGACSIHLVIRHTKPHKKNSTSFISISGSKCGGVWKNLKMSHSMTGNSAVWKALAVRFSLLDRARRAAHCGNIGFSIPDYEIIAYQNFCLISRSANLVTRAPIQSSKGWCIWTH